MGGAEEVKINNEVDGVEKSGTKDQLPASVDSKDAQELLTTAGGVAGCPEVTIVSLSILSPDRPDLVLPIPADGKPKGTPGPWFTLKSGGLCTLRFTFQVNQNTVSGLKYTHTVWRSGIKVDSSKKLFGTFSPRAEPYFHELPEATIPPGLMARGSYTARYKFVDDDNKCYMELNYSFDIRKEWGPN